MGIPVVIAENGFGLPVTDATETGLGVPMTVAENGYGTPVVIAENGYGTPAVFDPPLTPPTEPPANLSAPSIADTTPTVGETISCFRGIWSNPPNTYDYQWYRVTEEDDPFAFIDSATAGAPAGGGTFSTGAIDTTGATLLIIGVSNYNAAVEPTISDSKGNTWTALSTYTGSGERTRIYYSIATSVGASHTATATGVGYACITFVAFSGSSPTFDLENGAGGSGTPASASTGITPSADNALVIANVCVGSVLPSAIGGGFTMLDALPINSDHFGHALAYLIQTTAAAADPDWTVTGNWAASIASFKYEE